MERTDRGDEHRQPVRAGTATGAEKALLHAHLQLTRDALLWKLEDLSEADVRKPMTGTGTNLLGIVKHLSGVEYGYFCDAFGRDRPRFAWETEEDLRIGGDMFAYTEESTEDIVGGYRRACAAADETITELDLDATGRHHLGIAVSLRWMLLNVLLDTARHAGHADVVREMIDGRVGMVREWSGVPSSEDEAFWPDYLARVTASWESKRH